MERAMWLSLEEIEHRYNGQWVLVKETAWDAQGDPVQGIVVAHDTAREKLVASLQHVHRAEPGIRTFVFYAGPKVPEGISVLLLDNLLQAESMPYTEEQKRRALAAAGRYKSGLGDLARRHDDYLTEPSAL